MPKYRVTAVNGRPWITEDWEVHDAKNALGEGADDWVEFSGVPFEDDRPGQLQVILSKKALVSFEEWRL